jgi:hypothetical protein
VITPTLATLATEHADLRRVASDAERHGLTVGRLLGTGGYGLVFEAASQQHGPCALKVPWVSPADGHPDVVKPGRGPNRVEQISLTGPFVLEGPKTLEEAAALLHQACARQLRFGRTRPLAGVLQVVDLGGFPAALLERVPGRSLRRLIAEDQERARQVMPGVAQALLDLHDTFGEHGDFKPDHAFVAQEEVVLIDPLGEKSDWVGSIGYVLPCGPLRPEGAPVADLAGLASALAEVWGGSLGWDGRLVHCLLNQFNGRFSRGLSLDEVLERMREGLQGVPAPIRSWILEVGGTILSTWNLQGAQALPDAPWCRGHLRALRTMVRG